MPIVPTKPLLSRSPEAKWHENNRLWIRRNTPLDSPDIRVERSNAGFALLLNRRDSAGGSKVKQYLLTDATNPDYFIARSLSAGSDNTDPESPIQFRQAGSSDLYIAKPWNLRQSEFDGKQIALQVESWDGATLNSETRLFAYDYKSATFRIATDQTDEDEDNWSSENQTIIPRFVPATLTPPEDDQGHATIANDGATILYAVTVQEKILVGAPDGELNAGVPEDPEDEALVLKDPSGKPITLLALNDGWAWMRTS